MVTDKQSDSISRESNGRRPLQSRVSATFDESPLLVFYEVTRACDLVCTHCRACAQASSHPDELTTTQSQELITQLTEFSTPPTLVLTGGDPFKRADIFWLLEYARSVGLEVAITPSATPLVTPQALRRLSRGGVSRLAISVDAACAERHDAVRGVASSFDCSLRILAEAHAAGITTQINTTLTPANVGTIDSMAELFATLNIDMWSVFFLVPVGRATNAPRLTADQCEAAFERLCLQSKRQPYFIKTTEAPHFRRFLIQHRPPTSSNSSRQSSAFASRNVNDGKGIMFVGHDGVILPSGFLPLVCGRFPRDHVVRVYQDAPMFRALRDGKRLEGKCHVCEFRNVCGGSRARAYAVTGNPFAEEPDCSYVPRAWAGARS